MSTGHVILMHATPYQNGLCIRLLQALEDARQRLHDMLAEKGFVKPDGCISVGGNMCHFITAKK
jgi:hypothetical protein